MTEIKMLMVPRENNFKPIIIFVAFIGEFKGIRQEVVENNSQNWGFGVLGFWV